MQITIKLFATLRNERFDSKIMELPENTTVQEIINKLNIDKKDAAIIFINNQHADFDTVLKEGDTFAVFPPIGGG